MPPIRYTDPTGSGTNDPDMLTRGLDRKIMASVHVSLPLAKELKIWLEAMLAQVEAQYGEIALPKPHGEPPMPAPASNSESPELSRR